MALSALPTGTLTFLFTDVAGSTRLWDTQHDAMKQAHARQADLIAESILAHNGHIVRNRGEGDSTFSVFPSPADALAAAAAFQCALHAEPWPTDTPLRIRAALHLGPAELRWGDYNSTAVNRCARIRSLASPGQTLVSEAVFEQTQEALPEGVTLRSLGSHRLKDLERPEQVFQLCHPDLPDDFAPLRSLDTLPTNLPQQLTRFVGREAEMQYLLSLFGKGASFAPRLLTLLGAGGAGKTRLALQVGAELLDTYPDGVWLVELAALSEESLVAQAVATALGLREEVGRTLLATLEEYLRGRTLLLVLDNCEHLVGACAALAEALLRTCPNLHILATSREALNIGAETLWRVPSLSLPEADETLSVEKVHSSEAVQLFIERAQAVSFSFALTESNAPALAQISRRLDGIPLALELAAARVRSLSVEQIAARLDDRFKLLTGGSRTALPRQQTLRALIDWSYNLLSEQEKIFLARLSVFAGGWTLEAAEQICGDQAIEAWEILDLQSQLVEKSLVVHEGQHGRDRYRLLETIREYARERLTEQGETQTYRLRHADFYSALAVDTEPQLIGPEQATLQSALEAEHDNMRSVLAWGKEDPEGAIAALRLASGFWRFWMMRGYWREGQSHMRAVLENEESHNDPVARGRALNGAGVLAFRMGDFVQARAMLEECLALWQQRENTRSFGSALANLAHVEYYQGNYLQARERYAQSIVIFREFDHAPGEGYSLLGMGNVAAALAEYAEATELFEQALQIFRRIGDRGGEVLCLGNIGGLKLLMDDPQNAITYCEQAITICRELNQPEGEALYLPTLGGAAEAMGDLTQARRYFLQALRVALKLGDKRCLVSTLETLAALFFQQNEDRRAARFYGCTNVGYDAIAMKRPDREQAATEAAIATLKERLGDDVFLSCWTAGQQLSLEDAAQEVLLDE